MSAHPLLTTLWLTTCLLLLYPIWRAWHRPWELLGLPFVCGLFGLYFYGYMAWQAAQSLDEEIPLWCRELGHVVFILSILGFYLGWFSVRADKTKTRITKQSGFQVYQSKLWLTGQLLAWGGVAAQILWLRSGIGYNASAYIYMLPQLIYPGTALGIVAIANPVSRQTVLKWLLVASPLLICVVPQLLGARRGPILAATLLVLVSYAFGRQKIPPRSVIIAILVGAGLLALAFLPMRGYLNSGETFSNALKNIDAHDMLVERTQTVGDNEYAYACSMIGTTYNTGIYQYGTKSVMLFLHWMPRNWWPNKPSLGDGLYPSVKERMPDVTGIEMGPGMSPASFAGVFEDFGFFAILFWWGLGWTTAKIYQKAIAYTSPVWCIAWINIYSCAHWLFAQEFGGFFVPMMFAQAGSFGLLRLLGANPTNGYARSRGRKPPKQENETHITPHPNMLK